MFAIKDERSPYEEDELGRLCNLFGIDLSAIDNASESEKRELKVPQGAKSQAYRPIYDSTRDQLVSRWAVLLLAVRVESYFSDGYREAIEFRSAINESELMDGEVKVSSLARRLGKEDADRIIRELTLTETRPGYVGIRPIRYAELMDLYHAIDPLPENVIIFSDRGRGWDTYYSNRLKRLGAGSRWGSLTLNLGDVLAGRPFDCKICQDANRRMEVNPDHPEPHGFSHGLRSAEGNILRAYADDIGFPEKLWPQWLALAP